MGCVQRLGTRASEIYIVILPSWETHISFSIFACSLIICSSITGGPRVSSKCMGPETEVATSSPCVSSSDLSKLDTTDDMVYQTIWPSAFLRRGRWRDFLAWSGRIGEEMDVGVHPYWMGGCQERVQGRISSYSRCGGRDRAAWIEPWEYRITYNPLYGMIIIGILYSMFSTFLHLDFFVPPTSHMHASSWSSLVLRDVSGRVHTWNTSFPI